jgi:3-phosphoshikimate 1-carboxyvinyltransferase
MNIIEIIPPKKPVTGVISIGGSKSYSNRALIMATLADGESTLSMLSESDDTDVLIQSLIKLGVTIEIINKTTVKVVGTGGHFNPQTQTINIGRAGTAMRFLTALCCLLPGVITLDGSSRMRERPIGDLVSALRSLGADISCIGKEGFPPLQIKGNPNLGSQVVISGSVSSQFITALLLIAPAIKNGLEVQILGEQISKSYIDMTIDGMRLFGVSINNNKYRSYLIGPSSKYKSIQYQVEGDASGASYLFGLAAITGGTITVQNINPISAQGDIHFVDILNEMGCKVDKDKNSITVSGPTKLKAVNVDMNLMPDTAQTLAVIAAFAKGKTHIGGLSTLRVKETDRIAALETELIKMGIKCSSTQDSITIQGGNPHGALIHTYKDHRMALAFSIAGAKVEDVQIEDPSVVSKSFPNFWEMLEKLGFQTKQI